MWMEIDCGLIVGNYCECLLLIMLNKFSISWTFIGYHYAKGIIDITLLVSKEYQPHDGYSGDHRQALGRSQESHPKSSFVS